MLAIRVYLPDGSILSTSACEVAHNQLVAFAANLGAVHNLTELWIHA